jgi:hypothetical protein
MKAALLLVPVVVVAAGCATVVPPVPEAPAAAPTVAPARPAPTGTVKVDITFYGGIDNDPPGSSDIAHPNGRHATAGGVGSYADPVTLATDPRELPPGTVVYDPQLKKYFVMEDDCDECISDWGGHHRGHVDLWTAPSGSGLLACEQSLTPAGPEPLEINPPSVRPVDLRPLYDAASNRCWPGTDPPNPG